MRQTSIGSFVKRLPPPKAPPVSFLVLLAVKKSLVRGHSFLTGLTVDLAVPFVNGNITYYGEQQFSFMANGVFKTSDSKKGQSIYVPLLKQGFDVLVYDKTTVYRVEIKTIYKGSIIGLSSQQLSIADVLAIFNPRRSMQSIVFRDISYDVPPRSYVLIKLQ